MKWVFVLLLSINLLAQNDFYEQYKKLQDGDTLIFNRDQIRKRFPFIMALMIAIPINGQIIMVGDKGYTPPTDVFPPSIPSGLDGIAISDDSLLFYWTNPPEGDFNRNVIWLYGAVYDSTSNDSIYIGGRSPNTTYGLRLLAVDNNGNRSAYSDSVQRTTYDTTSSGVSPPTIPTNLAVSDSLDDITLTWTNNPPNATNIVIMKNAVDYDTVAYPIATWTETDTIDGVFRTYKIYAYNAGGESDTTLTVTTQRRSSNTYYFSSTGSDAGLGTVEQPYQTIGKANSLWLDGLTVKFKTEEIFSDIQLVLQDNVVYTNYGGDERAIIRPTPLTNQLYTINANGVSGATVKNLEIVGRRWVNVQNSDSLIFDNIYCHYYNTNEDQYMCPDGAAPFFGNHSSDHNLYLIIKNSIFVGGFPTTANVADLLMFERSSYIKLENNYIINTPHLLLGMNYSHHVILRQNRFYNKYHAALNIQADAYSFLVENNYFEKTGMGLKDAGGASPTYTDLGATYLNGYNLIYRFNVNKKGGAGYPEFYYIWFPAIQMDASPGHTIPSVYNNRVYNNTIYDNYAVGFGSVMASTGTILDDNIFFNNALSKNGEPGYSGADSVQIYIADENLSDSPDNNLYNYNYCGATDHNVLYGFSLTGPNSPQNSSWWFENNLQGTYDVFDNPNDSLTTYTYWTPATNRGNMYDSLGVLFNPKGALIDAGRHLTQVNGNSSDNTVIVDDARVFFDGHGWQDADSICVTRISDGVTKVYARISSIDYGTNTLTLTGSLTVYDNDYVNVVNYIAGVYQGTKPDIGGFE